jgi:hypothetical protein
MCIHTHIYIYIYTYRVEVKRHAGRQHLCLAQWRHYYTHAHLCTHIHIFVNIYIQGGGEDARGSSASLSCAMASLPSLLIAPVQRLPRYVCFIFDFLCAKRESFNFFTRCKSICKYTHVYIYTYIHIQVSHDDAAAFALH